MNTSAIYHRPESEFAYLYNEATMHIRLQTAREDVKAVYLIHGDPYLVNKEKWFQKKKNLIQCPVSGRPPGL